METQRIEKLKAMMPWLQFLTIEDCKKLPTPRLLKYFKKYRSLRRFGVCGCCGEILNDRNKEPNQILNQYLDEIKEILDTREHIERK